MDMTLKLDLYRVYKDNYKYFVLRLLYIHGIGYFKHTSTRYW